MTLGFLGCGSGFTDSHNNAYFVTAENDIVFIDLSMLNINKALKLVKSKNNIYLLITHMHDDHVSGIPLFIQYLYYTMGQKRLNIVIPDELYHDVTSELQIKGILPELYDIHVFDIQSNGFVHPLESVSWLKNIIPTKHAPELSGHCFGYELFVSNTAVIYSGDTCQLSDFIPFLAHGKAEFYIDCSHDYGGIHLKWDNVKDELENIAVKHDVYLMHMDNREAFLKENLHGIQIAYESILFTEEE